MSNRAEALAWWKLLTINQKNAMIAIFRNSSDFRKDWSFEMIDKSSGTIEAVFLYTFKEINHEVKS